MGEGFVTVREAAQLKGVSQAAVYLAVREGRLPHERILGRVAVREADVLAWTPISYGGRPGAKHAGQPKRGVPMSAETREKLSNSQRLRWAKRKAQQTDRTDSRPE